MIGPLQSELERIARRLDARRWNNLRAVWWLVVAVAGLGVITLRMQGHALPFATIVLASLAAGGWFVLRQLQTRLRPDLREIARRIERSHPELQTALLAAIDQEPGESGLSYLQRRVIEETLDSAHTWEDLAPEGPVQFSLWARRASLCAAILALTSLAVMSFPRSGEHTGIAGLEVHPGNAEVERGNPVTITARFSSKSPGEVAVEFIDASGGSRTIPLNRTLEDPTFSATLAALNEPLRYRVTFDQGRSEDYTLTPFQAPRVERMEAELRFPEYLGRAPRKLGEARRISAIEQTELALEVRTNQPMRSAELHPKEGAAIPLEPDAHDPTLFRTRFPLTTSGTYRLSLSDEAGRRNDNADRLDIEVRKNRTPIITAKLPTRGERATPIQEVAIEAVVKDDFEIRAAGLKVQVPGGRTLEVAADAMEPGTKSAPVATMLALEDIGAKPNDLLVWNAWAEDIGPDGRPRRTEGDLHIVPVRHFDEATRQEESSMSQAGENRCLKCIRIQTEILNGTWSSLREDIDPAKDDLQTLRDSQTINRDLARSIEAELDDPELRSHARAAGEEMSRAIEHLDPSSPDLDAAVGAEQTALAYLYRLLPPERLFTLGRESSPSSGSPPTEDLELKDMRPRYESETTAQAPLDEENRKIRETLTRLRDLAQRQKDLNEEINRMLQGLRVAKSDEERAELERRLQRLRDQQRELLDDLDRARQQTGESSPRTAEATEPANLDQAREAAQQAARNLDERKLGDALAEGSRAQRDLEQAHENYRQQTSGELSERLRNLREQAREAAEAQQQLGGELRDPAARPSRPSLSAAEDSFEGRTQEQIERIERILEDASAAAQLAGETEPLVARRLEEAAGGNGERTRRALEAMRDHSAVGDPEGARQAEQVAARGVETLRGSIEEAASQILGSEKAALEYARAEIEQLRRAASPTAGPESSENQGTPRGGQSAGEENGAEPSQQGQQGGEQNPGDGREPSAGTGQGYADGSRTGQPMQRSAPSNRTSSGSASHSSGGGSNLGSIGGEAAQYQQWSDRLRDLEAVVDVPEARALLSRARAAARELRIESKRHSAPPSQKLLEQKVLHPLVEAENEILHALHALDRDRDSLAPVERDPVPDRYSEVVRRYYESLGQ